MEFSMTTSSFNASNSVSGVQPSTQSAPQNAPMEKQFAEGEERTIIHLPKSLESMAKHVSEMKPASYFPVNDQAWLDSPVDHAFVLFWSKNPQVREFLGESFDIKLPRGVNNRWAQAVCEQFNALPKGEGVSLDTKFASVLSRNNLELIHFLSAAAGPKSPIANISDSRNLVLKAIKERADIREALIKIFSPQIHIFLKRIAENKITGAVGLEETKQLIEMFLSSVNFKPHDADRAFCYAAREDDHEVMQIFLNKNLDKGIFDKKILSLAFMWAAREAIKYNYDSCKVRKRIDLLLGNLHPADIDHDCMIDIKQEFILADKKEGLEFMAIIFDFDNKSGVEYNKALVLAAREGHLEIVKLLLEKNGGVGPLFGQALEALVLAAKEGHLEIVKLLLEKIKKGGTDLFVDEALVVATGKGYLEIVKLLLEKSKGVGPLFGEALVVATMVRHLEIVKLLLEKSGGVCPFVDRALVVATREGHLEMVKLLLEKSGGGPFVGEALVLAAREGHLEMVKLFLNKGAGAHISAVEALVEALGNSNSEIANLILKAMPEVGIMEAPEV